MMSTMISSRDLIKILNNNKDTLTVYNKKNENSIDCIYYRSDDVDNEKNIPNIFITTESNGVLYPLNVLEREKDIPNLFNIDGFQADSSYSSYADKFYDYPNLFTLHKSYSEPCGFKGDLWEKYRNYTNVFNLSDIHHIDCVQQLEINNSKYAIQEKTSLTFNEKLSLESSSKEVFTDETNRVKESDASEKCSILEKNSEEKMSSALCFWCIVTGANVRDHNIKTYFPQREISSICIMNDIKRMLINMGTTYFLEDEENHVYKQNRNISITGLTPEMFESITNPILKCSNLYKMLSGTIIKWKEKCEDSILNAFIFAVSNILDDYERSIYAVSQESLLSLVDRLSNITPRLQLLANIICYKETSDNTIIQDHHVPCGINILNKIHYYLVDYWFSRDLFLKMLLYIFESCCLVYFRILSNWALKGVLHDKETGMFVQLKPDFEDEDICRRRNWNRFFIDESIEVPIFLNKYKNDILDCGKTINLFKKFNDLNVFLPDFTCCFDAVDTQKVYDVFAVYFKYDSSLKTSNCVKRMSNCYLFESIIEPVNPKENTNSDSIQNKNITDVITESTQIYLDNESYEFFQLPDWTSVNNTYDFNKPYGFFIDHDEALIYNDKRFDVINMIDYVPHSILIPARIQKNVCDQQILDLFFVQENLMGRLYYLSQCFFLMNWQFSSKLCETLFNGIVTNRKNQLKVFNSFKLMSILDEAIQNSFSGNEQHNLTLDIIFIPHLHGNIDISDVECVELNYLPDWPMDMILSNKILLKYRRIFMFANKLEYVSWSLCKARELLSVYKNDTGLQFRKINLFKYWMHQFVSSIQQYYKQVVVGTCWSELNENLENVQNYDDLFAVHKQYMHTMLRRCLMVVGLKDKLILLNKIYIEILAYYQALTSGQFYIKNSERLHSEFISMEQCFSRFVKLREMFYTSILKTVQTDRKHYVVQLESLITILGPSCSNVTKAY